MKKHTTLLGLCTLLIIGNVSLVKADVKAYSIKTEHSKKITSTITFKDKNLEKVVKKALNLGNEDVTTENIKGLEKLVTDGAGITDLSGLEYATNLKIVTFKSEKIISLAPLKNLNNLYSVGVPQCHNLPMSEILSLPNLTELDLSGLKYSSEEFGKLSKYNDMSILYLNGCDLKDISFVGGMNQLKALQVSENKLSNLDSVKSDKLIGLWANNNELSDIETSNFPNLQRVYLEHNYISNLSKFNNLKSLTHIYASYNTITNLSFNGTPCLTLLDLKGNQISNISLENLPKLESLTLNNNKISTISNWEELPVLKTAIFTDNPDISDIGFLSSTPTLETLSLQSCSKIRDFSVLADLQNINMLYLNYIPLDEQKLSQIGTHTAPIKIGLNSTGLQNISFTSQFPNLTAVALNNNHITDISSLPQTVTVFSCTNQTINLPKVFLNTGTILKLKDRTNITPVLYDWVGIGTLDESVDGIQKLKWSSKGDNSFDFESTDGLFSGTISQTVE